DLKNMLRQVQSDRSNLAHGWLPFAADSIRQQFGTQMPQGGHPPHHSITSSARSKNESGIVRPSALAVVRLTTKSNLVGRSTGMSPGFAPRRTRPNRSGKLVHRDQAARLNDLPSTMHCWGSVQNLSQCAGRPATSSRCKSDTMKE